MRAWTVDADDIRVADDFNESLLHRTPEIDGFLRSDRDDKFVVIGTKGFGKTLLLKAKRILVQREGRAACLPAGTLLDKPIGDKIFSRELLAFFVVSPLPWSKIWLTAISLAVLKHLGAANELKVGPALTRPDCGPAASWRHRSLCAPAGTHAKRTATLRDRYGRPSGAAASVRYLGSGDFYRWGR